MGTTADKLNKVLDSKAKIKAAIEAKGVENVGDVLADYPDKIASIQSGSRWTGHADVEGLKAIGWTEEDIAYYQEYGVNWNEEDDEYHKVPQDNIDLYGVLTISNINKYKNRIVYLPKISLGTGTNMTSKFSGCFSMVAIPLLDTSRVTNMTSMFQYCYSLVTIPLLDTSKVIYMSNMFSNCYSLVTIPLLNTNKVTDMNSMFDSCHSLVTIPLLDTTNVTNMTGMFMYCHSLVTISLLDTNKCTDTSYMFQYCYSLKSIKILNISFEVSYASYMFDSCYTLSTVDIQSAQSEAIYDIFSSCVSLINLKIGNLSSTLNLAGTNILSKDSLLYIINNSNSEASISITLSTYIYNKYYRDADVKAALSTKTNVSLAKAS